MTLDRSDSGRRPLTKRQRQGINKREVDDPSFCVQGVFDAGGGWQVSGYPSGPTVIAHNPHDETMDLDLTRLTARAMLEAADFAEFGPGEWVGDGDTHRWASRLDEEGNDCEVPTE